MKLNISKDTCGFAGLLLASLLLTADLQAQEQDRGKKKSERESRSVDVTITVKDAEGNILPGTSVTVSEGYIVTKTNGDGESSFKALPGDFVTVSRPGYEKTVLLAGDLSLNPVVVLS